jgi:hypothetical protein
VHPEGNPIFVRRVSNTACAGESRMNFFDRTANHIARLMGHPAVFALACVTIVI